MRRTVTVYLFAILLVGCASGPESSAQTDLERARAILERVPLIDGHNDVPWALRELVENKLGGFDFHDTSQLDTPMHTDVRRLREGLLGAQFWSVYVPASLPEPEAVRAVIEQIDVTKRLVDAYDETFEMALTSDDIVRIHRSGRIASLIGMEGGHAIGASLAVLRQLYELGARYMTLTHSDNTRWADSATDEPEHGGLSSFGQEVVLEMARIGMLIDLSHVSEETMHEVLDISPVPVIFSHSSARAISGHSRNVPDSVLRRLPENGGVVMVTFVPSFVSEQQRQWIASREAEKARLESLHRGQPDLVEEILERWVAQNPRPPATLEQVADHIDHVRTVAGVDHVGIGSDFDGVSSLPVGLEDVSTFPALFAELLRRGWSEEELEKLAGRNVLRVMRTAEEFAATPTRTPAEGLITDFDPGMDD